MVELIIIVFLLGFTVGFFTGRKLGFQRGWRVCRAEYPLELKEEALKNGLCPICHTKNEQLFAGKS